jgi:hypothetical protein
MSAVEIQQLGFNPHITVETLSEIVGLHGEERLEQIDVVDRRTGNVARCDAEVVFVMIGADAQTSWLPPSVARDAHAYVLTGPDARAAGGRSQQREPFALETTAPGIFAAGDVRSGSVKRSRPTWVRVAWPSRWCTNTWPWRELRPGSDPLLCRCLASGASCASALTSVRASASGSPLTTGA